MRCNLSLISHDLGVVSKGPPIEPWLCTPARVVEEGPTLEIINDPASTPYTQGLLKKRAGHR